MRPRAVPAPRQRERRVRRAAHGSAAGIATGLHHHNTNPGAPFDESRTGFDHISFGVAVRSDLDDWVAWLDERGVSHSGVTDVGDTVPYSVVVFRDPDDIQLELIHMPG